MKTINIIFGSIFLTFGLFAVGLIATFTPTLILVILKLIFGFSWKFVFIPSFIVAFGITIKAYNRTIQK
jgi:hypothetical protein